MAGLEEEAVDRRVANDSIRLGGRGSKKNCRVQAQAQAHMA